MEVLAGRILLRPRDVRRSQRFYEEELGLGVYREWGEGQDRGIVFFLGGGLLEISGYSTEPPSDSMVILLQVRALRRVRDELVGNGVRIEEEPELKPWGLLEMVVRDPDGHALVFVEVPADHPQRRPAG
jgi:catechol 2,3-dioxygenase-like lactoylglutathione lyase family enzyme